MLKKLIITSLVIVVLAIAFVLADYFRLFGTEFERSFEMAEAIFKPVNKKTGEVILDEVRVVCTQRGVENACTQKPSKYLGQVIVNVPLVRVKEKTLLFTKDEGIIKAADQNFNIKLILLNYRSPIVTFPYEDVINSKSKEFVIEMAPIVWENAGEETNE